MTLDPALDLHDAWLSRIAASRHTDRPVVGLVGADAPFQLPLAAGAVPLRLFGSDETVAPEATELLGRAVDAPTVSILTQVLAGRFDHLAGILVSADCQASVRLFYVLRELRRSGRIPMPVHLVEVLHLDRDPSRRFTQRQVLRAAAALERWLGVAITADGLRAAEADRERTVYSLRRLQAARRVATVSGSQFLEAVAVATACPADVALPLIDRVATSGVPVADTAALRIFVTGSVQHDADAYRAIESAGAHIVGEDHDAGDLVLTSWEAPLDGEDRDAMLSSIAAGYHSGGPAAPTSSIDARSNWSARQVRATGAHALLGISREYDDAPPWDFPLQSDAVGVPAVQLEHQGARPDVAALERAVEYLRTSAAVAS